MTIESEEFYNLMQIYRWSRTPSETVTAYRAVIDYIDEEMSEYAAQAEEHGARHADRHY